MVTTKPASVGPAISVTSLEVAEYFEKTHAAVLQSIRYLELECPPEFYAQNFVLALRLVPVNHGALRKTPFYTLTQEGFAILALGYVGKKTLAKKIAIVSAGNWSAFDLAEILAGRPASTSHVSHAASGGD